jgi:drug/metabolite transporter (DMT)-like permease
MLSLVRSTHLKAVLQALLVTFLWATSWVINKVGLEEIPAILFAGLRYSLAFLCLMPFVLQAPVRAEIRSLSKPYWARLIILGILFYAVTQGTIYVGLWFLPAVPVSILLNFTSLIVAFLGVVFLGEYPARLQWFGALVFTTGILVYFYPAQIPTHERLGFLIVLIGVLANAISSLLGRSINREKMASPLLVTAISMGIGASILLVFGLLTQGLPPLSPRSWIFIIWLAVVNTAFAFTLWNRTLQVLSAMESSIINGTMLVQIALLAWLFLGESPSPKEFIGMLLAAIGAILVQLRSKQLWNLTQVKGSNG